MGYEFSANIQDYSNKDIWKYIKNVCSSINYLKLVDSGDCYCKLNYSNNENTKWGSDVYIELSKDSELYILFNLAPDEELISLIRNELAKNDIVIEIEEL